MYYFNIFYVNSIIGYILESILYLVFNWNGNSGILFGPWTPVYGIGAIIITITFNFIDNHLKSSKKVKLILFFLIISVILAFIEIIGGNIIEYTFHEEFWNYEDHLFNIGKYTSIEMSIVWGIFAIIYILFIKKIIDKIVSIIPKLITHIITILFVIDLCATIIIKK